MQIEFLYWEGCPSWERALGLLGEAVERAGLSRDSIDVRRVGNDAETQRERFVGSPTIRINGRDLQEPAAGEAYGLNCRIYRRRDGGVSPLPDPDDLREALNAGRRAPR